MPATLRRRALLLSAAMLLAPPAPVGAHTPYRQWVVYRRRHLLVGCHRRDGNAYERAKAIEVWLAEALPAARVRVARAPDAARLASLLATDQLELALVRDVEAAAMRAGTAEFAPYGAVSLETLAGIGRHRLVAVSTFPAGHTTLLLDALAAAPAAVRPSLPKTPATPLHPAAADWFAAHG